MAGYQMQTIVITNKKAHGLKAQPLKDFILGSSSNVNRKLLTHILTNVNTHPPTKNFSWLKSSFDTDSGVQKTDEPVIS